MQVEETIECIEGFRSLGGESQYLVKFYGANERIWMETGIVITSAPEKVKDYEASSILASRDALQRVSGRGAPFGARHSPKRSPAPHTAQKTPTKRAHNAKKTLTPRTEDLKGMLDSDDEALQKVGPLIGSFQIKKEEAKTSRSRTDSSHDIPADLLSKFSPSYQQKSKIKEEGGAELPNVAKKSTSLTNQSNSVATPSSPFYPTKKEEAGISAQQDGSPLVPGTPGTPKQGEEHMVQTGLASKSKPKAKAAPRQPSPIPVHSMFLRKRASPLSASIQTFRSLMKRSRNTWKMEDIKYNRITGKFYERHLKEMTGVVDVVRVDEESGWGRQGGIVAAARAQRVKKWISKRVRSRGSPVRRLSRNYMVARYVRD